MKAPAAAWYLQVFWGLIVSADTPVFYLSSSFFFLKKKKKFLAFFSLIW